MGRTRRLTTIFVAAILGLALAAAPVAASSGERTDTEIPMAGEDLFGQPPSETAPPEPPAPDSSDAAPGAEEPPGETPPPGTEEEPPMNMHGSTGVPSGDTALKQEIVWARVANVISDKALADSLFAGRGPGSVVLEAVVEEGPMEGATISVLRELEPAQVAFAVPVRKGDAIYVHLERDESGTARGAFSDFRRFPALLWAGVAAMVLLLACIPRKAGFKVLFVLLASAAAIGLWFVPRPSLLAGAGMCAAIVALATVVFYGVKYRTIAACCGTLLSLAAGGLLALAGGRVFYLSGLPAGRLPDAPFPEGAAPSLSAVYTVCVLLSTLGIAIMASNVTAAAAEPRDSGDTSPPAAFARGMRRGISALIPLVTSLGFILLGGLLAPVVLLWKSGMPAARVLSDELVAAELTRLFACLAAAGLSVPVTAAISALLLKLRAGPNGMLREFHVREALSRREHELFGKAARKLDAAAQPGGDAREDAVPAPAPDKEG